MGLLTKTVKMKPSGKSISYYKNLGYDARWHEELEVKVEDLPANSNVLVDVQCDNPDCGHIHDIHYSKYTKNQRGNNGLYYCEDCWNQRLQNTLQNKYGVTNISYLPEIHQKKIETSMKKYGVPFPNMSEEFRELCADKREELYGYREIRISQEAIERRKQACIERYGCENPLQNQGIKEKTRKTNKERYGFEYISQVPQIQDKARRTMYKNGLVPTSTQQQSIYNIFEEQYDNVLLNYPIGKKYSGDIVIDNIDFEVDYGGHNLSVKRGNMTQEEFDQKQLIRDKIVKAEGYKIIRLIADKERRIPSDSKLLEILELSKQYFNEYPNHSWIEWHLDDGFYRNTEHKDGIPYDFGELHKIKKAS